MTSQHDHHDIGSIPIAGKRPAAEEPERPAPPPPPAPEKTPPPPVRPRAAGTSRLGILKWPLALLAILVVLHLLAGYLLVPLLVPTVGADLLGKRLGRPVTIARARCNPFGLSLTLENTIIGPKLAEAKDPVDPLLSFSRLRLDLDPASFYRAAIISRRMEIEQLFLHVVRQPDKSYNIIAFGRELFGSGATGPRFALNNIVIENSRLRFDDQPTGKTHAMEQVNLAMPALANFSFAARQYIEPRFSATINGSPLSLTGKTTVSGEAIEARLTLQLSNFDLAGYAAYLPGDLSQQVTRGTADLDCALLFSADATAAKTLQLDGVLAVRDVALRDKNHREISLARGRFDGAVAPLTGGATLRLIELDEPRFAVDRDPDGRWHLPLAGADAKEDESAAKVTIGQFTINGGTVELVDRKVAGGYAETWQAVQLSLQGYDRTPGKPAAFALSGKNRDGGRISLQGEIDRDDARGLLVVDRLSLTRLAPYLRELTGDLRCRSGTVQKLETRFTADLGQGGPRFAAWKNLSATVENLALAHGDTDWLRLGSASINSGEADWTTRQLTLGEFKSAQGFLLLHWNDQGRLNWSSREQSKESKPWRLALASLDIQESSMQLRRQLAKGTLDLRLDSIACQTAPPTAPGERLILSGTARLNGQGAVRYSGPFGFAPFGARLSASLEPMPLGALQSLLGYWLALPTSGTLQASGLLALPDGSFSGKAVLENPALTDRNGNPVAQAAQARAELVTFTLHPMKLALDGVNAVDPSLAWTLRPAGRSSLGQLLTDRGPQKELELAIGSINLAGGRITLSDQRINPAFHATMTGINGTIASLANRPDNRSRITLQGTANESAALAMTGDFGFFDDSLFARFDGTLRGLPAESLNPYLLGLVGHEVTGGSLDMEMHFSRANQAIEVSQAVQATALTLGKRRDGDRHLPLVQALLTNQQNSLSLALPVSGTLNDPDFSYRKAVAKTINGLLAKAAIAPFALLREQHIPLPEQALFEPGKAGLSAKAKAALSQAVLALRERPLLRLTVNGVSDGRCDRNLLLAAKQEEFAARQRQAAAAVSKEISAGYGREEITAPPPQAAFAPPPPPPRVSDQELLGLAEGRIKAAIDYLLAQGLKSTRIAKGKATISDAAETSRDCDGGVQFALMP